MLAHADAQHQVLGIGILALEIVQIVGAYCLKPHLVCEPREHVVEARLGYAVVRDDLWALVLELDVEILFAKDVDKGLAPLLGDLVLAAVNGFGDDARNAGTRSQDALVELLEAVQRNARLVVVAVCCCVRHDAHEVAIALVGLGQQDHMVELGLAIAAQLVVGRKVNLAAQDGLDARSDSRLVELRAAVHVAVVCDSHSGHAQLLGVLAHVLKTRGAV